MKKEWAIATATVIAVVNGMDNDGSLAGLETALDQTPSVRRTENTEYKYAAAPTGPRPTEVCIRVSYGPVLGNSPSDLRRWMRNGLARLGVSPARIVVLFWNRKPLTQREDVIDVCARLRATMDDVAASAIQREWASRRLTTLMEQHGLSDADLPVSVSDVPELPEVPEPALIA